MSEEHLKNHLKALKDGLVCRNAEFMKYPPTLVC